MRAQVFCLPLFLIVTSSACGDGSDPSPREQCETMVENFCDKLVACFVDAGGGKASDESSLHETCVDDFHLSFQCSKVVEVSESYDRCLEDIDGVSCSAVLADDGSYVPASCNGVLKVR